MLIPKPPYHGANNNLLYAILTGGDCLAYQELLVDSITPKGLTFPAGTVYALIIVEANSGTADKTKVIRFKEADNVSNPPTAVRGIPLGDLSVYEVKGTSNLTNFKVIGIEAGKVHSLKIQYFG